MTKEEKEQIFQKEIAQLKDSWTWAKLTETERTGFLRQLNVISNSFDHYSPTSITPAFIQEIINSLYQEFLTILDYEPLHWRDEISPDAQLTVTATDAEGNVYKGKLTRIKRL